MTLEILESLLAIGAIGISFLSILWMLGTKDRHKIIKILQTLTKLLEEQCNGKDEGTKHKGGDTL